MTPRSPHLSGDVRAAYAHMLAALQECTAPDPLAYDADHPWCNCDVRRHMTSWLHALTSLVTHRAMSGDQRGGLNPSAPVVRRRDDRAGEEATAGGDASHVSDRGGRGDE